MNKFNVFTIPDKVHSISMVEKGDRKKFKFTKEFNISPNTLSSILKQKDKILVFNNEIIKEIMMTPYFRTSITLK